jgi:hypothetical protein
MLAHRFPIGMLSDMIRARFATAEAERMVVGGRAMEVTQAQRLEISKRHERGRRPK